MLLVISLLCILSLTIFFSYKLKLNNAYGSFLSFAFIGLVLFFFGLINKMIIAYYLILGFSIISFIYIIYLLLTKKLKIKDIFSLPIIIYIVCYIILYFLLLNTHYTNWDEFAHWGPNLKAMFHYDLLYANKVWDGNHIVYPPFIGLIEYFFCKLNGSFSEGVTYIAINSFILTCFLPLISKYKLTIKNIFKSLILLFLVIIIMIAFEFKLTSVYIDFVLGVLFFFGMYISYNNETKESKVLIFLILLILPIVKDTGLLFSAVILVQLGLKEFLIPLINKRKLTKDLIKKILYLLLLLVTTFIGYFGWKLYCNYYDVKVDFRHDANNISSFELKEYIKSITYIKASEGKQKDVVSTFYSTLNNNKLYSNLIIGTTIGLLGIFTIVLLFLIMKEKDKEKKNKLIALLISYLFGFILYSLFLLCIYLFGLPEHEARNMASYARYMSTYLIAGIYLLMMLIIFKKKFIYVILMLVVCFCNINILSLFEFIPTNKSVITLESKSTSEFLLDNLKTSDRVYIIYQNNNGFDFNLIRYQIAPIRTNLLWEWSLGTPYGDNDPFTYDISKNEFVKNLLEYDYDYIYFANVDKNFTSRYGKLFNTSDPSTLQNNLYKIKKEKNNVIFKYIATNEVDYE